MEEREIDLLDLLVEILLRWRPIVLCMLICGVLAGGFSYMKSYKSAQSRNAELQNMEAVKQDDDAAARLLENTRKQLKDGQVAKVESILYKEDYCAVRQSYFDSSKLMQLDPEHVSEIDIVLGVAAEDNETAAAIAMAYGDVLNGAGVNAWIAEKNGGKIAADVSELVIFEINAGSAQKPASRSIPIRVLEQDRASCEELAGAALEYVKSVRLSGLFGNYELLEVSNTYTEGSSAEVLDKQKSVINELFSVRQEIATARDSMTAEEQQYYDLLVSEESAEESSETEEVASAPQPVVLVKPTVSKKYLLLGLVLGAFLYAGVVAVLYIMSNKLHYGDDIARLYRIPVLGQIPAAAKKKKFLGFIDEWILAFRYRNKRRFSAEEALRLASVAVKMEVLKSGAAAVYCVGCNVQGEAAAVCASVADALKADDITVKTLSNVLYDAEEREQLRDAQAAVLVEKNGGSIYAEIAQELELLERQGVRVLGSIVVE